MFEPLNLPNFQIWILFECFQSVGGKIRRERCDVHAAALQFGLQGISIGDGFDAKFLNFRRAFPIFRDWRQVRRCFAIGQNSRI